MTNILVVTSSPRGAEGLSTRFATEVAEGLRDRLGGTLVIRDLAAQPLPHITLAYIEGRIAPSIGRTPEQTEAVALAETLVNEVKAAEVIVIGSGMINFSLSSQLKAWMDHIIWPGVTFSYDASGVNGLLSGKKAYVVTASGGVFSEGVHAAFDFQTNYLEHLLGFMGITDIETIRVEGTAHGPEATNAAIAKAETLIRSVLEQAA